MTRRSLSSKYSVLFTCSIFVVFMLASCSKPNINFGVPFVANNNTNIVVVDTFSTLMSTVYTDSFQTAGTGSLLVGRYSDAYTGQTTAKTYYQLAPPVNIPTISNVAGYDSLVLITRVNNYYYGDTTIPLTYLVSQLSSLIQLPGTQLTFYNNDSIPYESTPLGSATARIFPLGGFTSQLNRDSLKIKLPDSKGQQLFTLLQNKSPIVTNVNTFFAYFKGLAMYPDGKSQGAVYGFKDTVIMRLYYHEPGVINTPLFTDFTMFNKNYQFNQLSTDRTGTPLQSITSIQPSIPGTPVEISSDSTNHASYVQSASGMEVKIKFPYIWKLQQAPDYVSVLKADLIIKPVAGTYSPEISLPPRLEIYQTDDRNLLGAPVTLSGAQYGGLFVDYIYGINTSYTYDVTSYIRSQLLAGADNNLKNGIMLVLPQPEYNTTINRAVIGDRHNDINNRISLKVYYASFY